jgi:cytochrome c oxidase subunit 4
MEDPALVIGIPFLVLGLVGLGVALLAAMAPEREAAAGGEVAAERHGAHPTPAEYIQIGVILAVITAVEVALYYVDAAPEAINPLLILLSVLKFALVVLWFMHLRFDSRLFTVLFTGGLLLAASVFIVVIATLGAGLV